MEFWHLEEDRGGFSAKKKSPFNLHEWCDIWDKVVLRWEFFCDIIASQWFGAAKRKKKAYITPLSGFWRHHFWDFSSQLALWEVLNTG